ncbi:ribosomal RNA-processing protein 7 homolog A [Nilaparvata lugens]|uniref:ribosomal RNA-processing protein 7 homolog A n=1 Tax=Nilaparvata lugens TaxID=108931 RepID=UPI00193CE3A6|nr:ribosomal RNA-processing protein 7 homolog A [Nilaparvata lugens]
MEQGEICGYKVIPLKIYKNSAAHHYLYLKEHSIREKCLEKPSDRTLFVLGVPPYCTQESLSAMFAKQCGRVKAVYIHSKPTSSVPPVEQSKYFRLHESITGFKVAYIVFEKEGSREKAMKLDSSVPLVLTSKDVTVPFGIEKWLEEYNDSIPNVDEMLKDINDYVGNYDMKESENKEKEKALGEADEDGWVTVTKRGRKSVIARKESVNKKIMKNEKKKRAKKELLNFYRFQIKESKMNSLIKLREKFEEDKKKIAVLKQTRKFKPFA